MTWVISRLGSRFSLVFQPYQRRILHGALGRFHDMPLDLKVGFIQPDGIERVMPFTLDGVELEHLEQLERFNSITFRGYSRETGLRCELNIHSPFYPQDKRLCIMPTMYMEIRINPTIEGRWPSCDVPDHVTAFFRIQRPDTDIAIRDDAEQPGLDLTYPCPTTPHQFTTHDTFKPEGPFVDAHERITSLQPVDHMLPTEDGMVCRLPVTEEGSGIKWRLVWSSYVADPIATIDDRSGEEARPARLLYTDEWASLDEVVAESIETRDDRMAHSRRLEKLAEQMPLGGTQRHLLHQSFQNFLTNTLWLRPVDQDNTFETIKARDPYAEPGEHLTETPQWFSVADGSKGYQSPLDVEYNNSMWYLTMWPALLAQQFRQWGVRAVDHEPSEGASLEHDLGLLPKLGRTAFPHRMPVEENSNFLLLLQAYTRFTGDTKPAKRMLPLVTKLAKYLQWADRDECGFATEGVANTAADAGPALQLARRQVYLGIKRVAALRAAADILALAGELETAKEFDSTAETAIRQIEDIAWRSDHYAVCVDESAVGITDPRTDKPLPFDKFPGVDAYSIYTTNGLVLPTIIGQPPIVDPNRIRKDVLSAARETFGRYGCAHTSDEPQRIRISQNLWRDIAARYLDVGLTDISDYYWDMQLASNTHQQSLGFADAYMNDDLFFMSRGITAFGFLLAGPMLIADRLAAGGCYITVNPQRHYAQRWPLFALADWKANKIPTLVVNLEGEASIEGQTDPVIVQGQLSTDDDMPDMIG